MRLLVKWIFEDIKQASPKTRARRNIYLYYKTPNFFTSTTPTIYSSPQSSIYILQVSKPRPLHSRDIKMILSRLLSITLRFAQFVCAAVVLVLTSILLHQIRHMDASDCHGRLIYSVMIAGISVVASLLWLLPTTSHVVNIFGDIVFCGAWFAVFGLLQDYYRNGMNCGGIWEWDQMMIRNGMCSRWNAAQAFGFLSAVFWCVSFGLGVLVWRRGAGRI